MLRAQKDTSELLNPSQNIHLNSFIRLFVPECRDIHFNGTKLCTPKYSRKKKKPSLTAKLKQFRDYLSTEQTKIVSIKIKVEVLKTLYSPPRE
ncbi:hypothetical protein RUM43_008646 [Polyplax serrata]|uniref:Uncharacterized protein n=1 Tax=Polyplax serrata TaxID=468196 RepID=A0AAN8S1G9_POLSC